MKKHLVLMGPPGAGKTTTSKLIGKALNMQVFDIDDDLLEVVWNMPVSQKLQQVGEEGFIQAEGQACMNFSLPHDEPPQIIALSGSVPLHRGAIENMRRQGVIIYLDIPSVLIEKRLHDMKVDRIVGMRPGQTLSELLDYRKTFYEQFYDVRVACDCVEEVQVVADRVIEAWNTFRNVDGRLEYVSTRGYHEEGTVCTFNHVVRRGLAPDRGLFVPKRMPTCSRNELFVLLKMNRYQDVCLRVLEKFPLGSITPQELKVMIEGAYRNFHTDQIAPVVKVGSRNQYYIELWHGPTAAFKDVALQLVPRLFSKSKENASDKYVILAATSGDTGISTIEGYKSEENVSVLVLYPRDGVSKLQEKQMLCAQSENVRVLAVNGDFDKCQGMVKDIFSDSKLNEELSERLNTKLSSANSINWARIMPQIVYYVTSYLELVKRQVIALGDRIDIVVPTGNFGNLLAAIYASKIGFIFVNRFICASNSNNVLEDFINTGTYDINERDLQKTSSPSIDILKSSNVERLLYLLCGDSKEVAGYMKELDENKQFTVSDHIKQQLRQEFLAFHTTEEEVQSTINGIHKETGMLIDTHTAVAQSVANKLNSSHPVLIASTAHWSKFPNSILESLSGDSCTDMPIEDVFTKISNYTSCKPHPNILSILEKPNVQPTVCSSKEDVTQYLLGK